MLTVSLQHDDYNHGHVKYQGLNNALDQGIAAIRDGEVYLGVDYKTALPGVGGQGRNSFRLESKVAYKHGLMIARFSHMPAAVCGSWPAL